MPFTVSGWNPFYEGWIAALLGQSRAVPAEWPQVARDGWCEGWDTANQTISVRTVSDVIAAEVRLRHISIDAHTTE